MSNLYNGSRFGAVIKLTIHSPAAEATLKGETDDVLSRNGAEEGTAKVKAMRIPRKWAAPIVATGAKARNFCERNSMKINGQYVVPLENLSFVWQGLYGHTDISSKVVMGGILGEFIVNVAALRAACETGELATELAKLGEMASQVEVIDCAEVAAKYGIDVAVSADVDSPVVRNLLGRMDKDLVAKLETRVKADAEAAYNQSLTEISGKLSGWICRTLKKLESKCNAADIKGLHFKGLVDDIRELVEECPKYNVLNDEKAQATIADIYKTFGTLEKDAFKDEATRKNAAMEARRILEEFTGTRAPATVSDAAPAPVAEAAPVEADALSSVPS